MSGERPTVEELRHAMSLTIQMLADEATSDQGYRLRERLEDQMTEIADRLEEAEREREAMKNSVANGRGAAVADLIEANAILIVRVSAVERERDEQKAYADEYVRRTDPILDRLEPLSTERDRLQAENERLVAVIDEIMLLELTHEAGPLKRRLRTIMEREAALRETDGEKGGGRG